MRFQEVKNGLLVRRRNERLLIEAWGTNALRVRATQYEDFTDRDWALEEPVSPDKRQAKVTVRGE